MQLDEKQWTEFMMSEVFKTRHWEYYTSREDQKTRGDVFIIDGGVSVDFKFDQYDNDNIVIELKDYKGESWTEDLDDDTIVMWVKCATGWIYAAKMEDIRKFMQTDQFKLRKSVKMGDSTMTKNFHWPELQNVSGFYSKATKTKSRPPYEAKQNRRSDLWENC